MGFFGRRARADFYKQQECQFGYARKGVTRIDTIVVNPAAAAVTSGADVSELGCKGYDHLCVYADI